MVSPLLYENQLMEIVMKWYGFSYTKVHDEAGPLLWGNWLKTLNLGFFKISWIVMK